MISDFFEIFLLSVVQGVSEFLPISSAAHLILISSIYEFKNQSLLIDISLHLGSLIAILFYFRDDIFNLKKNKNLFYKIVIGTTPIIIFGYLVYITNLIDFSLPVISHARPVRAFLLLTFSASVNNKHFLLWGRVSEF